MQKHEQHLKSGKNMLLYEISLQFKILIYIFIFSKIIQYLQKVWLRQKPYITKIAINFSYILSISWLLKSSLDMLRVSLKHKHACCLWTWPVQLDSIHMQMTHKTDRKIPCMGVVYMHCTHGIMWNFNGSFCTSHG